MVCVRMCVCACMCVCCCYVHNYYNRPYKYWYSLSKCIHVYGMCVCVGALPTVILGLIISGLAFISFKAARGIPQFATGRGGRELDVIALY